MLVEFPTVGSGTKAELELFPPDDFAHRGSAADLKLLFTRSNRIFIQDVFVQPFSEDVAPAVLKSLTDEVTAPFRDRWQGSPDFKLVTSRVSCVPAPECKFTWLRVDFELGQEDQAAVRPIACKLYPESLEDTVEITSSLEISGELTIKLAKGGSKSGQTTKVTQHQYSVKAHGAFSPTPGWDFQKTEANPAIAGDITLLMVVACPPGVQIPGEMKVSARVELKSGSIIPLVMRRTSENAAGVAFML